MAKDMTREQKLFKKLLGTMIDVEFEQLPKETIIRIANAAVSAFEKL